MFNYVTQKFIASMLVLSTILAGASFIPALAQAKDNNGLHMGLSANANVGAQDNDNEHAKAQFHQDTNIGLGVLNLELMQTTSGSDGKAIKEVIKPAQNIFKQAVKDAKTAYKNAKKNAQVQFKASMKAATSQADRIAAIKTYFANVLAAFKVKTSAIETAFQAFINTNFTINHKPIANAQTVNVNANSSVNITLSGSDPEGSLLTYVVVNGALHGTLSGTAPNLTYSPNAGFTGSDSFTFKVNDGSLDSTLATVSIIVH